MWKSARSSGSLVVAVVALSALAKDARAEGPKTSEIGPALSDDPTLRAMVAQAIERRPELARVRAQIVAERERVPQTHVLPDPTLSVGIQNDGFGGIQIGKMESSWVYIVASQTLPWPGKRGLRADIAGIEVSSGEAELRRAMLTVVAEVERAYVGLLLVREQQGLLARLESLWRQSEALARARYEAGEGSQSDLLRSQLERNRLAQKRWALQAEEWRRVVVLNRLRGHPFDEAIPTARGLPDLPDPVLPDVEQAIATSWAESPEIARAKLAESRAERRVDLAKKERLPDLTVSAGVMPRWGNFDTMWQAGVSLNLPIWSLERQTQIIAENQSRRKAAQSGVEVLRQLLAERVRERFATLRALMEANRLYRSGLLVESEATVSSTLVQYQVGRVTFASVLEALSGYLADVNGFLDSLAAAQRIAIAEREISLDAPDGVGGGPSGTSVPGADVLGTSAAPASRAAADPTREGGASSMSRM